MNKPSPFSLSFKSPVRGIFWFGFLPHLVKPISPDWTACQAPPCPLLFNTRNGLTPNCLRWLFAGSVSDSRGSPIPANRAVLRTVYGVSVGSKRPSIKPGLTPLMPPPPDTLRCGCCFVAWRKRMGRDRQTPRHATQGQATCSPQTCFVTKLQYWWNYSGVINEPLTACTDRCCC